MSNELEKSTGITNPMVLLQSMVDKGVDPEAIKKMMDLAERWQANQALQAFNRAMNAAQRKLPCIVRDKRGDKGKMYAPLETINHAVKQTCMEEGLVLSFGEEPAGRDGFARIICDVRHIDGHVQRYHGDYPLDGTGAKGGGVMSPIQGRVSSMTYAKRDLTCAIFNLTIADTDLDGAADGEILTNDEALLLNDFVSKYTPEQRARFDNWLTQMAGTKEIGNVPRAKFAAVMRMLSGKGGAK